MITHSHVRREPSLAKVDNKIGAASPGDDTAAVSPAVNSRHVEQAPGRGLSQTEIADGNRALDAQKCRELWCAVIDRAFHDAHGFLGETPANNTKQVMIAEARAWFGTRDFAQVCNLAGLDPSAVLDAYKSGRFQPRRDHRGN